jgi:Mn-dependent DtxR family transcriptional regulator
MSDYAGSRRFLLIHESIATLLGVRREGITEAAHKLQAAALINYRRGNIMVLDRKGLEKKSCECYRVIRQQYKGLHRKLPRLLSSR